MSRLKLFLLAGNMLLSLTVGSTLSAQDGSHRLRNGDLVFVALPSDYHSGMLINHTDTVSLLFIHTAIVEIDTAQQVWIIDATLKRGVARRELDAFLCDFTLRSGDLPYLVAMRPAISDTTAATIVATAKTLIGKPYDTHFTPDNDSLYCSELVAMCYMEEGIPLFDSRQILDFKNPSGEYYPYWTRCFKTFGTAVPQGRQGVMPQALYDDSHLRRLSFDFGDSPCRQRRQATPTTATNPQH